MFFSNDTDSLTIKVLDWVIYIHFVLTFSYLFKTTYSQGKYLMFMISFIMLIALFLELLEHFGLINEKGEIIVGDRTLTGIIREKLK